MEKATEASERPEKIEEPFVKSLEKDVLVSDIHDVSLKEIKRDGDVLVMVGAEIVDSQDALKEKPTADSRLVSVPTVLQEELEKVLTDSTSVEKQGGLEEAVTKDRSTDGAEKFEKGEDMKHEVEKEVGTKEDEKDSAKKEKKNDEKDSGKKEKKDDEKAKKEGKEKKEKKDKDGEEGKKEKEKEDMKEKKNKEEKKKEKKEKKSKKSDVERIQKKLEKIHGKIERILAKKEEYLQRLAEAEEKERQHKERSAEETAKREQDLATVSKPSDDRNVGASPNGKGTYDREADIKQMETPVQSSAKQRDESDSTEQSTTYTDTIDKAKSVHDEKHSDTKITDQVGDVETVRT